MEATGQEVARSRQVVYWRLLSSLFNQTEHAPNIERITQEVVADLGMPAMITEPTLAVDTLVQRYPELKPDFDALEKVCTAGPDAAGTEPLKKEELRHALCYSKLLLNVFGPNT